jgi:hypothetical protein
MFRLVSIALSVWLLVSPFAAAAKDQPSRRGQVAVAKERSKRVAKEAKRRQAVSAQQQNRSLLKQRSKEAKRTQPERAPSGDRRLAKERRREIKHRQQVARRDKAVHVLDAPPNPKPDQTPKPKQRGTGDLSPSGNP